MKNFFPIVTVFLFTLLGSFANATYGPVVGDMVVHQVTDSGPAGGAVGRRTLELLSYDSVSKLWTVRESWSDRLDPSTEIYESPKEYLHYRTAEQLNPCEGGSDWGGTKTTTIVPAGQFDVCRYIDVNSNIIYYGLVPFGVVSLISDAPLTGYRHWELVSFLKK